MNRTAQLLEPEVRELLDKEQYRELRDALAGLEPHDVSEVLEELDAADAAIMFRLLNRETASAVFADLDADQQEALIGELGEARAGKLVESLSPDDRAAFLDELPPRVARGLIQRLSPENRRVTQQILGYPEQSVGRHMTPDYVRIRPDWTVARALEHLRKYGRDAETVHWVFVVDDDRHLIDDLHIRTLLLADPQATIASLMDERFIAVGATDDQEHAVRAMADYDRSALPVIDRDGVLLGIVTYDDIADIAEAEATEDIQKLGGVEALDEPYMQTSLAMMVRKRGLWLGILFVFQVLTIGVMGAFSDQLEKAVILMLFVPLIISAGGNTGTQAASLLVRALALREVEPGMWRRVLRRELLTGLCLGGALGLLGFVIVVGLHFTGVAPHDEFMRIGFAVGVSVLAIVTWATALGSAFPLILDKLGLDPATISSPLVATLMDLSGIVIYFVVAVIVLTGSVL